MQVNFYESTADENLKFAVIAAKYEDKWVFVKHRMRDTLEFAGGHREIGEEIAETARRELFEETGAEKFSLSQICVYSVISDDNFNGKETFGMLYFAEIHKLGELPESEIERVFLLENPPEKAEKWTYPLIQPRLLEKVKEYIGVRKQ